jgi:hypothetical protein
LGFKGLVAEVVLRFRRLSLSRRHVPLPVDLGLGVSLKRRALTRELGTRKEDGKESEMEDGARERGGCRNPAGATTWERSSVLPRSCSAGLDSIGMKRYAVSYLLPHAYHLRKRLCRFPHRYCVVAIHRQLSHRS